MSTNQAHGPSSSEALTCFTQKHATIRVQHTPLGARAMVTHAHPCHPTTESWRVVQRQSPPSGRVAHLTSLQQHSRKPCNRFCRLEGLEVLRCSAWLGWRAYSWAVLLQSSRRWRCEKWSLGVPPTFGPSSLLQTGSAPPVTSPMVKIVGFSGIFEPLPSSHGKMAPACLLRSTSSHTEPH